MISPNLLCSLFSSFNNDQHGPLHVKLEDKTCYFMQQPLHFVLFFRCHMSCHTKLHILTYIFATSENGEQIQYFPADD